MCRPGPAGHAGVMNTSTLNPEPAQADHRTEPPGPGRTALRRPLAGRMLGGVAEGLARYAGVDTTIVRIAFVVLTIAGGAGIPLYLAGLLLIPDEGSDQSIAGSLIESLQSRSR
jgi:phage shock protein PspC (stress-responsive transcriptional regulator)